MKRTGIAIIEALLGLLPVSPAAAQANLGGALGSCERACLIGMADAYFSAMVAHDPSEASMAPTVPRPRSTMSDYNACDFESVHIFKIQKGQIHDIEAMGISLPYRSKNGWSEFWR